MKKSLYTAICLGLLPYTFAFSTEKIRDLTEMTVGKNSSSLFKTDDSRAHNTKFDIKRYELDTTDYNPTSHHQVELLTPVYELKISKHAHKGTVKVLGINAYGHTMTTTVVHIDPEYTSTE